MTESPESVKRFPLQWPSGWTKTLPKNRQASSFTETVTAEGDQRKRQKRVTRATATERLEDQVQKLGGADPTLSTNVKLRLDGSPDNRVEDPQDPGAAIYFRFKGKATVLACDRYHTVAENIAALAAHIDALRRIERYGVGTIEQALAGYKALPADTAADWRMVLGFSKGAVPSLDEVDRKYKELARMVHPDKEGGSDVAFQHLARAKEYAVKELTA